MARVVLWTDGSCPKPDGPGGYAAILQAVADDGGVLKERVATGGTEATTNNRMELMAVISGLEMLDRQTPLTIVCDSEYVINGYRQGWVQKWKRNGWRTGSTGAHQRYSTMDLFEADQKTEDPKAVKNRDLWERLDALVCQHVIAWRQVKGHLKPTHADWTHWHANNVRADELAGAETKKMMEALAASA